MRGRVSLGFLSCAARRTRIFGGIASSPTGPGGVARTILIILIRIVIVIIIVIIIIIIIIVHIHVIPNSYLDGLYRFRGD